MTLSKASSVITIKILVLVQLGVRDGDVVRVRHQPRLRQREAEQGREAERRGRARVRRVEGLGPDRP